MYKVLERGTQYMRIQLTGVSGSTYDVKINNVTKSNLAYNAIATFTGLAANTNYTVSVFKSPQKYIRVLVRNNSSHEPLSLAEVKVYDFTGKLVSRDFTNIKSVTQTSSPNAGTAVKAIDGNTSGIFSRGSVTHTSSGSWQYWILEFKTSVSIKEVHIYNRTDCCQTRLKGAILRLEETRGKTTHSKTLTSSTLQKYTFPA